jgi:hypothetical protein
VSEGTKDLLTIRDLAERWGVSIAQAKKVVKMEGVPLVNLRSGYVNINWALVRFLADAVVDWERRRQGVFVRPASEGPVRVTAGKLGDWRS